MALSDTATSNGPLREPTEKMLEAADYSGARARHGADWTIAYRAMLEAILTETGTAP